MDIRVNIQRGRYILVPHDGLNYLNVGFRLADSGTKCMSKMVAAEVRQDDRFSVFLLCPHLFDAVVIIRDAADCTVQRRVGVYLSEAIAKNETRHPIDFAFTPDSHGIL